MTVLPEKSTLFPLRFPRNLPFFPFNLVHKDLIGLLPKIFLFNPFVSLLFFPQALTKTKCQESSSSYSQHVNLPSPLFPSAGVAVAAYKKMAGEMTGKHAVVVCCGGNVSGEVLDKAYALIAAQGSAAL